LVFDKSDVDLYEETMNKINNAIDGSTVYINQPPSHTIIEYKPKHGMIIVDDEKLPTSVATLLNVDYVCVAIGKTKKTCSNTIIIGEKIFPNYTVYDALVEPLFAITYDKSQGKTLQYVILCLHNIPGNSATLAKMFVGFTRVTNSIYLRVWPALDKDLNLERFLTERHDLTLVLLNQAYDINGRFQDSLYMAAYQRYLEEENLQSHHEQGQGRNVRTRNVSIRRSAMGMTTTNTSHTSRIPSVAQEGLGVRNRNDRQLSLPLPNIDSTEVTGQLISSRNTSVVTRSRRIRCTKS
jgi:hypothetical protein